MTPTLGPVTRLGQRLGPCKDCLCRTLDPHGAKGQAGRPVYVCRFGPPQVGFLMVPVRGPLNQPVPGIQRQSAWPVVEDEHGCYQFVQKE